MMPFTQQLAGKLPMSIKPEPEEEGEPEDAGSFAPVAGPVLDPLSDPVAPPPVALSEIAKRCLIEKFE